MKKGRPKPPNGGLKPPQSLEKGWGGGTSPGFWPLKGALFEAGDALFEGRMGGEQGQEAFGLAGDLQGLEGLGTGGFGGGHLGIVEPAQGAQGVDHVLAASEPGTAGIGPELAPPGEPAHYQRTQDGEDDLEDHDEDELQPAAATVTVVAGAHGLADDEGQDARQEHD